MNAAIGQARFPTDLALRRQLWKQWVRFDPPQGESGRATRMAKPRAAKSWSRTSVVPAKPVLRVIRQTVRPAPSRSVATLVSWCLGAEALALASLAIWVR